MNFIGIYFRVIGVFRGSINLWFDFFANGFDDSATRGDGLQNWLEHLLGRGAVTLELHMSLIVGDRISQKSTDSPFDVLGAIDQNSIEIDVADFIDCDPGDDLGFSFLNVFRERQCNLEVGLVLRGLTTDEEEDDKKERDVTHARDRHGNTLPLLFT